MRAPDTVDYLLDQLEICRKQIILINERHAEVSKKEADFTSRLRAVCSHQQTETQSLKDTDTLGNYAGCTYRKFCIFCGLKLDEWREGKYG